MTTQNETKLKILINSIQPGTVVLAPWLEKLGISRNLQKHYLKSGWLETLGRGAYKKPADKVTWLGGVYSLQQQADLSVHVGAITALSLQGLTHYLRMGSEVIWLFSPYRESLPKWFTNNPWESTIYHQQTSFLPDNTSIIEREVMNLPLKISSPERAMLECLYLAPDKFDLIECMQLMEGLVNLRPKLVQELLENCKSVKVKRLLLYMADKANHQWFSFVNTSSIDLGSGNRRIAEKGVYNSKYQITIPKELAEL